MKRLLLALLFALLAAGARAETLTGVVIVVIDGDTVLFKPDHYAPHSRAFLKLRLAGIDAPEAGQAYGTAATQSLKQLALKRRATFVSVATDRYGRRVGWLDVGGVDASTSLAGSGLAWPSREVSPALRQAVEAARDARRGLWADNAPVPPWVWRRGS